MARIRKGISPAYCRCTIYTGGFKPEAICRCCNCKLQSGVPTLKEMEQWTQEDKPKNIQGGKG